VPAGTIGGMTSSEPLAPLGNRVTDFDFLAGSWRVHHRRRPAPLQPGSPWVEWSGWHRGATFFDGAISVDETELAEPGERGLAFRTFDPASGQWSIYWVVSRDGHLQTPPVVGRFEGGVGMFTAVEVMDGREVGVRFTWSGIGPSSATWRQAFSLDGGRTWEDNWVMRFER